MTDLAIENQVLRFYLREVNRYWQLGLRRLQCLQLLLVIDSFLHFEVKKVVS